MKSNLNGKTSIENVKVKIKTRVNRTENIKKVKNSIINITTEKTIINRTEDNYLYTIGDIELLRTISKLIKSNEISEVANTILNKNKQDNGITFFINKQAAYHNKFHMIDENMSTLDDIEVIIDTQQPDAVIDWILN